MQIKRSFDKETMVKIFKGALISGTGAVGLYILAVIGQIEISDPILVSFLAWMIPMATNMIKEWLRGVSLPKAE